MGGFVWTKAAVVMVSLALFLPVAAGVPILAGSFISEPPPPPPTADPPIAVEDDEQAAPAEVAAAPASQPVARAPRPLPPLPTPSPAAAVSVPLPPAAIPAAGEPAPGHNPGVLDVERRLVELSYLVGEVDGIADGALKHGITAFQKVEGLERTGELNPQTLSRLGTATRPEPLFRSPPSHFEVDIPRQVVFVVQNGAVLATLPTATGNNKLFTSQGYTRRAVTPNGEYRIDFIREGWRHAPLGDLYRPRYFNGGIAFHGSYSIPTQPASHGCVRLPMQFADWFADHAPIGATVYVYGGPSGENPQPELDVDAPVTQAAAAPAPPPETEESGNDLLGALLN